MMLTSEELEALIKYFRLLAEIEQDLVAAEEILNPSTNNEENLTVIR